MGCFDAAPMPGPAEPSPFRWFGRGKVLELGHVAGTVVLRYASAPAELVAPSFEPSGRLIPIVRYTTRLDARLAFGLGRNVDVTLTQPLAISQAGSGPDALVSQSPPPLASSGFGDPRLSLRTNLPESLRFFDWAMRLEFAIPLGSERAYLGNRDKTEAIALNAHWSRFGLSLAMDLGVQVSRPTRIGDVTLGTHAFCGLGVDFAPLPNDLIHVSVEGLVRPNLAKAGEIPLPNDDNPNAPPPRSATWVMPTEWLASISSKPLEPQLWFSLGAGTALPLSHREGGSIRSDAWFIAPSTPRYQLLGSVAFRN